MADEKGVMGTGRLEAFSDGVIAIIITIMVLELKAPARSELMALAPLLPKILGYALSFIYVGIYWNNHHHMLRATPSVSGGVLWANLHLLFWMSLIPFVTEWMGDNHFASVPTALYGVVLLLTAVAFLILQATILHNEGCDSTLARAIGNDWKGRLSAVLYAAAIGMSFVWVWVAHLIYVVVAAMWFVPDRRIERVVAAEDNRR